MGVGLRCSANGGQGGRGDVGVVGASVPRPSAHAVPLTGKDSTGASATAPDTSPSGSTDEYGGANMSVVPAGAATELQTRMWPAGW